jgi:tetratricopeptide (TPR) repeat protein
VAGSNKRRRLCLTLVAALLLGRIAGAQSEQPKRPELPDGADANDPYAYSRLGLASLVSDPRKAADAYYWAARLNPVWAEAYYGRRTALLLREPRKLASFFRGDKGAINSKEALAIDSLYAQALALNPFLGPHLDRLVVSAVFRELSNQSIPSRLSAQERFFGVGSSFNEGPWEMRAMEAYDEGRYDDALRLYAKAIPQSRLKAALLAERGRLFYQVGRHDSARVETTRALEEMRKQDEKDLVFVYRSKALMEERIGVIHHVVGNNSAAKEAFGRALQEDLSYFPAHVQLGYLALETGDSATATNEMDLAVQIRPDDAGLRYQYGYALSFLNKLPQAEEQLKKAIELNSDYALPHFALGQVYETAAKRSAALNEYRLFLSLASKNDPRRQEASQHVEILKSTDGTTK